MACHGARRLLQMTENLFSIVGIEAISAAQGIDLRAPLSSSPALDTVRKGIRAVIPKLEDDRYMADDLKRATELVASGRLIAPLTEGLLPVL
nr:Histidine ammonia-lyase [Agrobacterium fabrum]